MRRISETLRSTFAKLGIGGAVARAGALEAWSGAARVCLGNDATRTRALRIEDGTLIVGVPSPVLAQELRLRSADVLAELARRAPDSGVVAVRFVPR